MITVRDRLKMPGWMPYWTQALKKLVIRGSVLLCSWSGSPHEHLLWSLMILLSQNQLILSGPGIEKLLVAWRASWSSWSVKGGNDLSSRWGISSIMVRSTGLGFCGVNCSWKTAANCLGLSTGAPCLLTRPVVAPTFRGLVHPTVSQMRERWVLRMMSSKKSLLALLTAPFIFLVARSICAAIDVISFVS